MKKEKKKIRRIPIHQFTDLVLISLRRISHRPALFLKTQKTPKIPFHHFFVSFCYKFYSNKKEKKKHNMFYWSTHSFCRVLNFSRLISKRNNNNNKKNIQSIVRAAKLWEAVYSHFRLGMKSIYKTIFNVPENAESVNLLGKRSILLISRLLCF